MIHIYSEGDKVIFAKKYNKPAFSIFKGVQNNLEFSSNFDMNLYKLGERNKFPYMLGISIQGFKSQENGMPVGTEFSGLNSFEDYIIDLITTKLKLGYYAGHSYWNKSLELIFYVNKPDIVNGTIKILQHSPKIPYRFSYKIDSDPEWTEFKFLIDRK